MNLDLQSAGALVVVVPVLGYLFRRLNKLEHRLDLAEQAIVAERDKNSRLERLLERVGFCYEHLRSAALRLAWLARHGGDLREELLDQIEGAPEIAALLKSPLDGAL